MNDSIIKETTNLSLLQRAESILYAQGKAELDSEKKYSLHEMQEMFHHSEVHRVELELQKEELNQRNEELYDLKKHYFDFYNLAPIGYSTLNEEGLIIEANLTASTLLGVGREELIKKPFSHFILNEDQDIYYLYKKNHLNKKEQYSCELRMVHHDGTSFWVQLESIYQSLEGLPVDRLIISPISDRKKIEDGLEKTRKELEVIKKIADDANEFSQSVIDTVREPLISLDQNLRVVTVSHSFYDFFKVKPEDTVGQLIYDLGNKQWNIPKLRELLETILPQKTTFKDYEVEHNFATIGRRVMLLNARQIEQASGKERIILLAIEDITERKDIEDGLEKTRKELEAVKKIADEASEFSESVINTIREPLISLDKNLRVLTVSRSFYKFFKVKPEDTIGQLIYDLGNKQWNIPKLRELLDDILPHNNPFEDYEVKHNFESIGRRIMLLNARKIEQDSTKEKIILLAIEDITERRDIEDGLEKTRKELEVIKKIADDASEFSQSVIDTVREPLISLDQNLRVVTVSHSFYDFFKVKPEDTVGQLIYDLGNKQWNIPKLRELLETILPQKTTFKDYEVEHNFATIGRRVMLLNARQIEQASGKERIILLAIEDITDRKGLEVGLDKELQNERNRFSLAIEGSQDGLWDWNLETNEVLLTERFETMLGYNVGDLAQNVKAWSELLHPDDKEKTSKTVKDYLESKGTKNYESTFRLQVKDGSWCWILARGKALFDIDGKPLRFVGFNTDISEQMEYQDKLDHTAKHDSLTHLPNRFLLSELLTHAMHSVKRKNQDLALLFVDLDGFKEVNDTYGHDAGDEVLTTVAYKMNEIIRENDIVSRIGGDEFVIVVSDLKNKNEVVPILQRLLSDLSSNIVYESNSIHISASIGVSFYPQVDDIGNEILIRQADQAMYQAKLLGKNQYQFFNLEASQELKSQQQDILNLREAIKKDEFVLYYQPKVNMTNSRVIGFEALLRWNHPIKGLIYPDSFLPLVENEASFMIELGHWVLENSFFQLESWHLAGLDIMLSVNVSSHEVKQESFSTYLKELLAKHPGIEPNTVEIEILETSAFESFELTSNTLTKCQDLGVSIAIDDFGTGYASLHYLKKLPMNTLKIDKSFIIDLLTATQNISIVEASIGLAHAFNSHVVAEGVESEEHGKVLLQLGCEIAQGYVISKAMPAEEVIDWIESWKGFTSWETIKPINSDDYTILHASVEHNNWVNSLEAFLQNKTSKLPELDSSHCYLCNWISKSARKEQRNHSEFEQLKEIHSKLHSYAKKLLYSNEQDKESGIQKLRELHKKILAKLEAVASKI